MVYNDTGIIYPLILKEISLHQFQRKNCHRLNVFSNQEAIAKFVFYINCIPSGISVPKYPPSNYLILRACHSNQSLLIKKQFRDVH